MATIHIESVKEDVSDIVLMPGDPLRAKYVADNYLKDVKVVNRVRNMTAYTGYYNNKKVTVFPSGMGIPSMGIYAYELFKFYDVKKIIRIGTCGSYKENIKLFDMILVDSSYSHSTFAKLFNNYNKKEVQASIKLTNHILDVSNKLNKNIYKGRIITSDVFDGYLNHDEYMSNYPKKLEYLGVEMESFALFYIANSLNKEAACILTVVDSLYDKKITSSSDREKSLNDMIELALQSII